jgi:glutamate formiminotransferase / formiminotetrahydrofolate cyclodeaminase
MNRILVECVPNFSEGRDRSKVEAIVEAIRSAGVALLGYEMDADHNRSVVTFAGVPERVAEGAFRGVAKAVELIDLRVHTGVHPRIGAADVVPFVPVRNASMEDCVRLAESLGWRLWDELRVPVYFYEAAARRPERTNLEYLRRGQFEKLRLEVRTDPDRLPDFGAPELHPSAGATVVGARKFLIAYNINLNTPDVTFAQKIARAVRQSSGGFRCVKAMGVLLASRNLAQVSMNLTDFETTPVHRVFAAVKEAAASCGVSVAGSEIIGFIPRRAIEMTAEWSLQVENFQPGMVLENRLEEVAEGPGLQQFLDELSAPSASPGGGSAAAAAGAMAAALGVMVSALAKLPHEAFEADRRFFAGAVSRDAAAYAAVVRSYNVPKAERGEELAAALRQAALVPLEVAEAAAAMEERLRTLGLVAPGHCLPDLEVAIALVQAALRGATANVRVNLASLPDGPAALAIEARLTRLLGTEL